MVKILVADKLAKEGVKILRDSGFIVDEKVGLKPSELKEIISQYDGMIVRSETKVTAEIIEQAKNLKVIGRAGVGVDNIDVEAASRYGILVMNSPGGNTISTCEHTFALMLALARKIPYAYNSLKERKWERSKFKGVELYSKRLGIIGLGRIGKEVAKRAISFNMEVVSYDPFISEEIAQKLGIKLVSLEDLLQTSDFITIHVPLNEETNNMINYEKISIMKPTSFIINCSRGGIVNEDDLYRALKEKKIAGAALDVFSTEPLGDSPLLTLDNIIFTPHLGASTEEAQLNVAIEIAESIRDFFLSGAIRNSVNYIQIDAHTYNIVKPYLILGEKMGIFLSQLIEGRIEKITLEYAGEVASYPTEPIGLAFIKGFLQKFLGEEVNYINAPKLLSERKIYFSESKRIEDSEYVNSITAYVKTDKEERSISGALFSNREPRFVKIDNFHIEVVPSPYLIFINNWDKPGTIGRLGTILGEHNINIAGMSLGRRAPEDIAITILNIDTPITKEIMDKIREDKNIVYLKFIKI